MSVGSVVGAELDAMTTLKTNFNSQSDNVDQLMTALRSDLANTYWKGGAADRFRSAWETEYEPALRNLSAGLVDAASEVGACQQRIHDAGC